ncbi:MAG: hypothetical protein K9J06_08600 [Flavobacteriales bacterium]|nr:hypothetical protein [Flavobacteriales bacterium]
MASVPVFSTANFTDRRVYSSANPAHPRCTPIYFKVTRMNCTDTCMYCTDACMYCTDTRMYCTDRAIYFTDTRMYCTDRPIYFTDMAMYPMRSNANAAVTSFNFPVRTVYFRVSTINLTARPVRTARC